MKRSEIIFKIREARLMIEAYKKCCEQDAANQWLYDKLQMNLQADIFYYRDCLRRV